MATLTQTHTAQSRLFAPTPPHSTPATTTASFDQPPSTVQAPSHPDPIHNGVEIFSPRPQRSTRVTVASIDEQAQRLLQADIDSLLSAERERQSLEDDATYSQLQAVPLGAAYEDTAENEEVQSQDLDNWYARESQMAETRLGRSLYAQTAAKKRHDSARSTYIDLMVAQAESQDRRSGLLSTSHYPSPDPSQVESVERELKSAFHAHENAIAESALAQRHLADLDADYSNLKVGRVPPSLNSHSHSGVYSPRSIIMGSQVSPESRPSTFASRQEQRRLASSKSGLDSIARQVLPVPRPESPVYQEQNGSPYPQSNDSTSTLGSNPYIGSFGEKLKKVRRMNAVKYKGYPPALSSRASDSPSITFDNMSLRPCSPSPTDPSIRSHSRSISCLSLPEVKARYWDAPLSYVRSKSTDMIKKGRAKLLTGLARSRASKSRSDVRSAGSAPEPTLEITADTTHPPFGITLYSGVKTAPSAPGTPASASGLNAHDINHSLSGHNMTQTPGGFDYYGSDTGPYLDPASTASTRSSPHSEDLDISWAGHDMRLMTPGGYVADEDHGSTLESTTSHGGLSTGPSHGVEDYDHSTAGFNVRNATSGAYKEEWDSPVHSENTTNFHSRPGASKDDFDHSLSGQAIQHTPGGFDYYDDESAVQDGTTHSGVTSSKAPTSTSSIGFVLSSVSSRVGGAMNEWLSGAFSRAI